jgi:hypothetical protein
MSFTKCSILILLVLACFSIARSERPALIVFQTQAGCALIDKAKPPQYISYESMSPSSYVFLRLRNNSSCSIMVETDDELPTKVRKRHDGSLRVDSITDAEDGTKLALHYLIEGRHPLRASRPAYGWGDSVFVYKIPPGQSILFKVSSVYFKRRFDIVVPFAYVWEDSRFIGMGAGGVSHRVYFLFEDVPKSASN